MHLIKTILTICIVCLGIVVSNSSAEPAVVIKADEPEAGAFDGDGNIFFPVFCDTLLVETNSKTGVTHASCRGKGIPNSTGQAQTFDPYNNSFFWQDGILVPCGFFASDGTLVFTYDWT